MSHKTCFFCGREGVVECGSCGGVSACCPAHLWLHWRGEGQCFPWAVEERPVVGRCMVTTRAVKAGETLFQEEPVVIGPNQVGSAICLSCYSSADLSYLCTSCSYPLCGPVCQQSPVHKEECQILSRGNPPVFEDGETDAYHCIMPLRLVLLSRSNPEIFSLTERLMDHEEHRKGGEDWLTTEETVVDNILNKCQAAQIEGLTVDQVRRALGVLEVNSYEVHSFVRCGYRGCFPVASLLSHGCVANSRHIWSTVAPYTNTCIATVELSAGQEIITSYHQPTVSSLLRRPKLLAGWYFSCCCKRCSSRDELGTNLNTIVCRGCNLPSLTPEQPLVIGSDWTCPCGHRSGENSVMRVVTGLLQQLKVLSTTDRYNIAAWLSVLDEAETLVHPQHEAIVEICKWLLPILCRSPNSTTEQFPRELLRRKLHLSTSQLAVLDVIDPGYSKARAKCLYEVTETEIYLLTSKHTGDGTTAEISAQLHKLQVQGSTSNGDKNVENNAENGDRSGENNAENGDRSGENNAENGDRSGENESNSVLSFIKMEQISDRLEAWRRNCREIVNIFDRLGCNQGFETILMKAASNILRRCFLLKTKLDKYDEEKEKKIRNPERLKCSSRELAEEWSYFSRDWSLLQLWIWQE